MPAARWLRPGGCIAFTVERSDRRPFQLTDSGRFAHHEDHVREVAGESGLTVVGVDDAVPRYEYGRAVDGLVAVLKAPAEASAMSPSSSEPPATM